MTLEEWPLIGPVVKKIKVCPERNGLEDGGGHEIYFHNLH